MNKLGELINSLRGYKMSDMEKAAQRLSFVFGNTKLANPEVTREMVAEAATRLANEGNTMTKPQVIMPAIGSMWTHAEGGEYKVIDAYNHDIPGLSSKFVPTVAYRSATGHRFATDIVRWNERFTPLNPKAAAPQEAETKRFIDPAITDILKSVLDSARAKGIDVGSPIVVSKDSPLGQRLAELILGSNSPDAVAQLSAEGRDTETPVADAPCDCAGCAAEAAGNGPEALLDMLFGGVKKYADEIETRMENHLVINLRPDQLMPDVIEIGGVHFRQVEEEASWLEELDPGQLEVVRQLLHVSTGPAVSDPKAHVIQVPVPFQQSAHDLGDMGIIEVVPSFDGVLLARWTDKGIALCLEVEAN